MCRVFTGHNIIVKTEKIGWQLQLIEYGRPHLAQLGH
jgi:hypothetical protein